MRSQEALRPGVAILAAALLALAWIPAAASNIIVNVNETVPAVYVVDNPCTAAPETITLTTVQGQFNIEGRVTFNSNGTTYVNLTIIGRPWLRGTDTAGGTYIAGGGVRAVLQFPKGTPLTFTAPFTVNSNQDSTQFYLNVRFVINPQGNPNVDFVTFSTDTPYPDGLVDVQCARV